MHHHINVDIPEIGLFADVTGWCHPDEARALYDTFKKAPIPIAIELGSFIGKSLCVLGKAAKEINGYVFGVDKFDCVNFADSWLDKWEAVRVNLERKKMLDRVFLIKGDHSKLLDCLIFQAGFIYIDGGHTLEDLIRDFMFAYKTVVPGGYIAVHDYNHEEFPDVKLGMDMFQTKYDLKLIEEKYTLRVYRKPIIQS